MKPPPGAGRRADEGADQKNSRHSDSTSPLASQPDLSRDLRELWWHCLRRGHRLPAEPGIILIDGDRR